MRSPKLSSFDFPQPVEGAEARHPGEMRLIGAMLLDAIEAYRTGAVQGGSSRDFVEARQWIFGTNAPGAFSFTTVCAYLGLDPQRVRQELRKTYDRSNET